MIELLKAEAEDFLPYKYLSLNLENQGLVCLVGEQDGVSALSSNSSGKTSLLSAITYPIWGKLLRDTTEVSDVIRRGAKSCRSYLEGRIDGSPFSIERTRTSRTQEIKCTFGGNSRKGDVQAEINSAFRPFNLAQNTIFLGRNKALEFLNAMDSERRAILGDLLKVGSYRKAQERIKEDIKSLIAMKEELLNAISIKELTFDSKLQELFHAVSISRARNDEEMRLIEARMKWIEEHRPVLLSTGLQATEAAEEAMKQEANRKKSIDGALSAQRGEDLRMSGLQSDLVHAVNHLKLVEMDSCPTCAQPMLSTDEEKDSIRQEIEAIKNGIAASTELSYRRRNIIASLEQQRESFRAEANRQISIKQAAEKEYFQLTNELAVLSNRLAELKSAPIPAEIDPYKHKGMFVGLQAEINNLKIQVEKIDAYLPYMEFWADGFGPKGIQASIINHSLPLINQQANTFLGELTDHEYEVEIRPTIKDDLTFHVMEQGDPTYLKNCSEGAKGRIVISLFFALSFTQHLISGSGWNCRFLDEIADVIDAVGVERVIQLLKGMVNQGVSTIVVTSHRSEVGGYPYFDKIWKVKKSNKISELIAS